MEKSATPRKRYFRAGLVVVGALIGGIAAALVLRAVPVMMSRFFSSMMMDMMRDGDVDPGDFNPMEMCKRMRTSFEGAKSMA
jgi:hypothetical protein